MRKLIHYCSMEKISGFAPLAIRLAAGLSFFLHGWQKIFQVGPAKFGAFLAPMGVPAPVFFGYLVSYIELLGGAALILGLFTHWAAKLLALDMIMAIILVHAKKGFFASSGGIELVLLLLAINIALLMSGPGRWALDNYFKKK